jgi:hypothetical protein
VIMAKDSLWELLVEQRQLSEQAIEGDPRAKTKQNEHGVHSLVNLLAATADAVIPRGQWRRPSVTTTSSSSSTVSRRHLGDFHQLKMRAHAVTCSRTSVSEKSSTVSVRDDGDVSSSSIVDSIVGMATVRQVGHVAVFRAL